MSRGLRNNNPLNIERSSTNWQGLSKEQTDPRFFQFISVAFGYRAAFKTLDTYQRKYGLKTIRQFVSRWAPMNENPTDSYVMFVSKKSGIESDAVVSVGDKGTMVRIVAAMSEFENGVPAKLQDVEKGYDYYIY